MSLDFIRFLSLLDVDFKQVWEKFQHNNNNKTNMKRSSKSGGVSLIPQFSLKHEHYALSEDV